VKVAAPRPAFRLIPSKFPPIGLFDTVATAADLAAVMELVGWTNDRLVADRIARLPENERVFGTPNSSIVMGAFLHCPIGGMRFNGPELGAWYAANDIATAAAEVGHHLRRELVACDHAAMIRTYRTYTATLLGEYLDIRGLQAARPHLYLETSYEASQIFGEEVRTTGGDGLVYDSLQFTGGVNVVAYRPRNITEVLQTEHYEIAVSAGARTINVRKLTL
jgi:RES domain